MNVCTRASRTTTGNRYAFRLDQKPLILQTMNDLGLFLCWKSRKEKNWAFFSYFAFPLHDWNRTFGTILFILIFPFLSLFILTIKWTRNQKKKFFCTFQVFLLNFLLLGYHLLILNSIPNRDTINERKF